MTIYMKVEKKRKVEFSLGSRNSGERSIYVHLRSLLGGITCSINAYKTKIFKKGGQIRRNHAYCF